MPDDLTVHCYAGYKGAQEPRRFALKGCTFKVTEILDRWYGPDTDDFKVKANDGQIYILRRQRTADRWILEAYRRGP